MKKILIIGAGFAGIRCALDLAKNKLPDTKITLVSDKTHFEYHAALYRVLTGRSPLEVCIPLTAIFEKTEVEVVKDYINHIDVKGKKVIGNSQSVYTYDYLVLALGSETAYFNIIGLKENSYTCKTTAEALKLKRRLHEIFEQTSRTSDSASPLHFVVVGAGPSGVEISGELAVYLDKLAKTHNVETSRIMIELFERSSQVLPGTKPEIAQKVMNRLEELRVKVYVNEGLVKEDVENIYLNNMQVKAKTVLWTAGVKANYLYKNIASLETDTAGRVLVGADLRAVGQGNVFIAGDGASIKDSGNAYSALSHGSFIAKQIGKLIKGSKLATYNLTQSAQFIPVGPKWAVAIFDNHVIFGYLGWLLRRYIDFRFFLTILPFTKAVNVFLNGKSICETCEICNVTI